MADQLRLSDNDVSILSQWEAGKNALAVIAEQKMAAKKSDHDDVKAVIDLLTRIAVGVEALAPKQPDKPKPKAKKHQSKIYVVPDGLEFNTPGVALASLDVSHNTSPLGAFEFESCMRALAVVRKTTQRLALATYTAAECADVRTMLSAYKPSEIARAIRNRPAFFADKTLSFRVVAEHIGTWLAASTGAVVTVDDVKSDCTRLLALLATRAPTLASDLGTLDDRYWTRNQWVEHQARIKSECASRKIETRIP